MELCLIFELQWKDNPGEKSASLGIWDKEENPALDWTTFKSYVGQNLGTMDDISVAYIDSEGDEIPIDSECEFQEALRFAWKQAQNNKETIIRVGKINTPPVNNSNGNITAKDSSSQTKNLKKSFHVPSGNVLLKTGSSPLPCNAAFDKQCKCYDCSTKFLRRRKMELEENFKKIHHTRLLFDKINNKLEKSKNISCKKENDDEPPKWFKTYMKKFKSEITEDIKSNVSVIVRQALKKEMRLVLKQNSNEKINCNNDYENPTPCKVATLGPKQKQKQKKANYEELHDGISLTPEKDVNKKVEKCNRSGDKKFDKLDSKLEKLENKTKRLLERKYQMRNNCDRKDKSDNESPTSSKSLASSPNQKQKKKKSSDEDSSDAVTAQRDVKLLKKIEKLHRSGEKKFEKLDSKLEKLETKTKRLLEKKSQSKSRSEKKDKSVETIDKGIKQRKKSNDISFATCLMDAVLLDSPSSVIHCSPGEQFVKVWNVMNTGALPWTDKTELCLSWGTPGMKFEKKMIKCPQLIPGEKGRIKVKAVAPDYPGTFESYWHFYHMGDRFGHWIDCAVIVDGGHEVRFKHQACENTKNVDFEYLNKEKFETLGNEEKIKMKMAELTQKLNGLQIEWSQQSPMSQNKRCCSDEETKRCCTGEERKRCCCERKSSDEERKDQGDSLTNSVGSDAMKENQRKIAENMVEIQKRLDDISLLHSPPTANKILEMAFGEDFVRSKKNSVDEGIEESDSPDDIDLDKITGKNIEPAEWKMLQLHPEFLKSCDLLREVQIRDDVTGNEDDAFSDCKLVEFLEHFCKKVCDTVTESKDLMDFGNNDLNKEQDVSDTFSKNIGAEDAITSEDKPENVDEDDNPARVSWNDLKPENVDEDDNPFRVNWNDVEPQNVEENDHSDRVSWKNLEYESDSDSEMSIMSFSKISSSSESDDDSNFIVVSAPAPSGAHSPTVCQTTLCQSSERPEYQEVVVEDEILVDDRRLSPVTDEPVPVKPEETSEAKKLSVPDLMEPCYARDSRGEQVWAVSPEGVCLPAVEEENYHRHVQKLREINFDTPERPFMNNFVQSMLTTKMKNVALYRPRRARVGDGENNEDENESKTKKLKSNRSTEYHFNSSEIPEKTLKVNDEAPSTFTFTAGNEEKKDRPCCSNCGYKPGEKRDKNGNTGKKGHNRHNNFNANYSHNFGQASTGQAKANDGKMPAVDLLPSPLLNGVLNVASTAFSTARTVLNNIKMPPMPESGSSKAKSHPSIESLCKLYEMGFKNVQANQKLLEMYENDVNKVLDELLNQKQ